MPDEVSLAHSEAAADNGLQFDRVVVGPAAAHATHDASVVCAACQTSIPTEYFDLGGHVVCERCRHRLELAAETPHGVLPLLISGACGLGAGIVGAIVYYSVIAIAHLEVGIVAILIGYMVGYAVRRGAGGRGGLRFQILAIALTYLSVAFAYTPLAISAVRDQRTRELATQADATSTPRAGISTNPRAGEAPPPLGVLKLVAVLGAFVVTLPIAVILGNLPSSLITLAIITFGMRQAFRMTAAPILEFRGPYRVGAQPAASA